MHVSHIFKQVLKVFVSMREDCHIFPIVFNLFNDGLSGNLPATMFYISWGRKGWGREIRNYNVRRPWSVKIKCSFTFGIFWLTEPIHYRRGRFESFTQIITFIHFQWVDLVQKAAVAWQLHWIVPQKIEASGVRYRTLKSTVSNFETEIPPVTGVESSPNRKEVTMSAWLKNSTKLKAS